MDELFRILPDEYVAPIQSRLLYDRLSEVRVINNAPVRVCYDGNYFFLCRTGITREKSAAFVAGKNAAEGVIMRACERSLYTVTDTLKRGYISVRGGIRIGVCGTCVMSGGEVISVKDYSSVDIRLPHEVTGCAAALAARIASGGRIKNTLIISPPGGGKTTVLRDLCRLISDRLYCVLLCDEKNELAAVADGVATLDVGACTDVISGVDKPRVFEIGIANMRPDVIMTDEIFERDLPYVVRAATCGISVIASIHADGVEDVFKKRGFSEAGGLFEVYATLSGAPDRRITISEGKP